MKTSPYDSSYEILVKIIILFRTDTEHYKTPQLENISLIG
jgi:hypothetical protein